MRVAAGMMVKDESDTITHVIRHLLALGVDRVHVLDNMSGDDTADQLRALSAEHGWRVMWEPDDEPAYVQSAKMTGLARLAAIDGYDWFVPVDADELWYSRSDPFALRDVLAGATANAVSATLYDHVVTDEDDPGDPNPFTRIRWRRKLPAPLGKVAVRVAGRRDVVIEQGNHVVSYGDDVVTPVAGLTIRHFPYRSADHFVRKAVNGAAAYAAAGDRVAREMGIHWRAYGLMIAEHGEQAARDWFDRWFASHDPIADGLVLDPALVTT